MKYFFLIFGIFLISAFSSCAQTTRPRVWRGYASIKLEYHHSMRIPYQYVSVELRQQGDKTTMYVQSKPMDEKHARWNYSRTDTTYEIEYKDFERIFSIVSNIDSRKLIGDPNSLGMDGETYSIELDAGSNEIRFSIWSPGYDSRERKLEDFYEACMAILKLTPLPLKEIIR